MKNFTNLLDQKNSLLIKKLDESCSLGASYKNFFIRVCQVSNDETTDKYKQSDQKEIVVIDFENMLTSYIPFNLKVTDMKNVELDITMDILVIKVLSNGLIKKVFLYKISQISQQERKQNLLKLVSRTNLRLVLVSSQNMRADDMIIVSQAEEADTKLESKGVLFNMTFRIHRIIMKLLKCENEKCKFTESYI